MIPPPAIGLYQAVFQPTSPAHDWHRNVRCLQDLEFLRRQLDGNHSCPLRHTQQPPSGSLMQMADQLRQKAHNDKPFFTLALRVAVIGARRGRRRSAPSPGCSVRLLPAWRSAFGATHHPGLQGILTPPQIREMLLLGLTHRPGFLVNSFELVGAVHIPAMGFVQERRLPDGSSPKPVNSAEDPVRGCARRRRRRGAARTGWCASLNLYAGRTSTSLGRTAQGKSTVMERMAGARREDEPRLCVD